VWRSICTTAIMVAWAVPALTGTYIFVWLFDPQSGLVISSLDGLGLMEAGSYNWFTNRWTFYGIATINVVYHGFPFIAVTMLARPDQRGLPRLPLHRRDDARRPHDRPAAALRGRGDGRRDRLGPLLERHRPHPAAHHRRLRDPLDDLGLQGLRADLPHARRRRHQPRGDEPRRVVLHPVLRPGRVRDGLHDRGAADRAPAGDLRGLHPHPDEGGGAVNRRTPASTAGKAIGVVVLLSLSLFPFYWMLSPAV